MRDWNWLKWTTQVAFPFAVILILAYVYLAAYAICSNSPRC